MRVLVFWVLFAPVAVASSVACGSEANKRPEGPAPVYEPWVLPSWGPPNAASREVDALDALLEGSATDASVVGSSTVGVSSTGATGAAASSEPVALPTHQHQPNSSGKPPRTTPQN